MAYFGIITNYFGVNALFQYLDYYQKQTFRT